MNLNSLHKIYERSDPVENAYIIVNGPVYMGLEGLPLQKIAGSAFVAGTLEYFLSDVEPRFEGRLFDLYIASKDNYRVITRETMKSMIPQFHFGYNTNIFLSKLIEITNNYYSKRSSELTLELSTYEMRAGQFADVVNEAERIARSWNLPELSELVNDYKKLSIYQDGIVYKRPNVHRPIISASEPITDFIEVYKANSCICREGTTGREMYILLKGKVSVSIEGRYITSISEPGEAFGEVSLFLQGHRTASIVAEEDAEVYVITLSQLKIFCQKHPEFFENIAHTLARRIHDNIQRIKLFEARVKEINREKSRPNAVTMLGREDLRSLCVNLDYVQSKVSNEMLKQLLERPAIQKLISEAV